jgi:hypothetical protein
MNSLIRRYGRHINAFLALGGVFGLGYLSLRMLDRTYNGLGTSIALTLWLASLAWIVFSSLWRGRHNRRRKIKCKICGAIAHIHVIDVAANSRGTRPAAMTTHYCSRHGPKTKIPKALGG